MIGVTGPQPCPQLLLFADPLRLGYLYISLYMFITYPLALLECERVILELRLQPTVALEMMITVSVLVAIE